MQVPEPPSEPANDQPTETHPVSGGLTITETPPIAPLPDMSILDLDTKQATEPDASQEPEAPELGTRKKLSRTTSGKKKLKKRFVQLRYHCCDNKF